MSFSNGITGPVYCNKCKAAVPPAACNTPDPFSCGNCGKTLQAELFPAILKPIGQGRLGENLASDSESSCYYHPNKRAATFCSACGRFLCSLCEIQLGGRCLCPTCLETGRQNESLQELVSQRTLHDSVAFSFAALPLFVWPITMVTAPVALYLSITGWKKPRSLVRRNRSRLLFAMLIALAQIAAWVAVVVAIVAEK